MVAGPASATGTGATSNTTGSGALWHPSTRTTYRVVVPTTDVLIFRSLRLTTWPVANGVESDELLYHVKVPPSFSTAIVAPLISSLRQYCRSCAGDVSSAGRA